MHKYQEQYTGVVMKRKEDTGETSLREEFDRQLSLEGKIPDTGNKLSKSLGWQGDGEAGVEQCLMFVDWFVQKKNVGQRKLTKWSNRS